MVWLSIEKCHICASMVSPGRFSIIVILLSVMLIGRDSALP